MSYLNHSRKVKREQAQQDEGAVSFSSKRRMRLVDKDEAPRDNEVKENHADDSEGAIVECKLAEQDNEKNAADFHVRQNDDGDPFLELSSKRRVTVRMFKKSILVDIREVRTERST